jgi:hypothetical protein
MKPKSLFFDSNTPLPDAKQTLDQLLSEHLSGTFATSNPTDLYSALNAFRDNFNQHFQNYDVILEDDWYKDEGFTTIEYDLRCKETKEFLVLAQDVYQSHQDTKGVWHLGAYQRTEWKRPSPPQSPPKTLSELALTIEAFIDSNTPLVLQETKK